MTILELGLNLALVKITFSKIMIFRFKVDGASSFSVCLAFKCSQLFQHVFQMRRQFHHQQISMQEKQTNLKTTYCFPLLIIILVGKS